MRISGIPKHHKRLLCALIILALAFAIYASLCAATGIAPGAYPYPSYLLQAQAWLRGKLALDRNYEYLELAIYEGDYYVSFPPVPSIPMLLWTQIWGNDVPGGLFQKIYVAIACLAVFSALRRRRDVRLSDCVFWAIFICFSCPITSISLVGAVWYEAQILAFLFCASAIALVLADHPTPACLLYALSVGCRPYSVLLGPVLLLLYLQYSRRGAREKCLRLAPGLIVGLGVAVCYGIFNYTRFGNPFEFGHKYLPEYQRSEFGQLSLHHIANNWRIMLTNLPFRIEGSALHFNMFGFSMFLSCPILLCNLVWIAGDIVRRRFTWQKLTVVLLAILNAVAILMVRSIACHQFGLRYALELVPFSFAYLLMSPDRSRLTRWESAVMSLGLAFNLIGACVLYS